MTSIAESVPIEILTQIFQNCYRRVCLDDNVLDQRDQVDGLPLFPKPFIPSLYMERRQFGRFRLVSQSWKAVADMFFIRDMEIAIRADEKHVAGYHSRQHRFLGCVFDRGYTHLIGNIYLELHLHDYYHLERPFDEPEGTALLLYTDLVCDLLTQHSYLHRQLFIEMGPEKYCEDEFHASIITNKIMNALRKLPTLCQVNLTFENTNLKHLNIWERNFETTLTARFSHLLSHNLCSLEIAVKQPISRTFFASLRCTKKLHVSLNLDKRWIRDEAKEIAAGIDMMPALEDLCLDGIPPSRVPKTLRRLSLNAPRDYFPDPEFFVTLCQINKLEDLRLFFDPESLHYIQWTFSLTQLAQITQVHLPNLRVLQICTTQRNSQLLTLFCSQVLRVCSSLQELKLHGVGLTNEIIHDTTTRSLRRLSLSGHAMILYSVAEIFAGVAKPVEQIQWNTLSSLFERNPNIARVQLDFDLRLPPLTYNDIEKVSKTCLQLNFIWMYAKIMDEDEGDMLKVNESFAYKLKWLYSRSTAAENRAAKKVLVYVRMDMTNHAMFALCLEKFRMLKDGDIAARNNGQRKKRKP